MKIGLTRCGRCWKCGREDEEAAYIDYLRKWLCRSCFIEFYEKKVRNTIFKHRMFGSEDVVGAAVSGGKDSMAMLRALAKIFPKQEIKVIHVNLGIGEYSRVSETLVRRISEELGLEAIIYNLEAREGFTLPDLEKTRYGKRICGACGIIRRYLLNKVAVENGVDVLVTGHTLDDVVELLFDLYLNGKVEEIVRVKPVLEGSGKLVKKVKPLIELTDEENRYYAYFTKTSYNELRCPLSRGSRMLRRKKLILSIEDSIPGFRHTFYKSHLKRFLPRLEEGVIKPKLRSCERCGMPSLGELCSYCRLVSSVLRVV